MSNRLSWYPAIGCNYCKEEVLACPCGSFIRECAFPFKLILTDYINSSEASSFRFRISCNHIVVADTVGITAIKCHYCIDFESSSTDLSFTNGSNVDQTNFAGCSGTNLII